MSGQIPRTFIDDLLGRVDIIDVIDAEVPLRKTGRDYQARCPFHQEKTPSFTVSREKQFYHCFGCGAHGSAIGFLMNYRNLGFVEAVEELASRVGLDVPREGGIPLPSRPDHGPLYAVLARAQQFYTTQLKEHPERNRAVEYLKQRGLTGKAAKAFGIGFAPPGWDNLCRGLGPDIDPLERAGMIASHADGHKYDRFRDRIMFPIHDRRGRVIGFGGRTIGPGEPKYLNSPETPLFQKRRELYAIHQVIEHDARPARVLVVEGYMDVVGLAQHGIHNAVATLGTATTQEHLEQLFRVTPEIIFCFDGDAAGQRAAWRALETVLGLLQPGRQAGFMFMPEGEDPDSLVRKVGADRFHDRTAVTPLSRFLLEELGRRTDLTSRDGRARLIDLAAPFIDKVPDGAFRDLLIDDLERLSAAARSTMSALRSRHRAQAPAVAQAGEHRARRAQPVPLVTRALMLLLQKPELARLVDDSDALLGHDEEDEDAALFIAVVDLLRASPYMSSAAVVEHWRGAGAHVRLGELAVRPIETPDDGLQDEFAGALTRLAERTRKRRRPNLEDARFGEMSEDEKTRLRERYPGKR